MQEPRHSILLWKLKEALHWEILKRAGAAEIADQAELVHPWGSINQADQVSLQVGACGHLFCKLGPKPALSRMPGAWHALPRLSFLLVLYAGSKSIILSASLIGAFKLTAHV